MITARLREAQGESPGCSRRRHIEVNAARRPADDAKHGLPIDRSDRRRVRTCNKTCNKTWQTKRLVSVNNASKLKDNNSYQLKIDP
jgi:hypothetical protein